MIKKTRIAECYQTPILGAEGGGKLSPQSVKVRLKDGKELFRETVNCKGTPGNPMNEEEFKGKYEDCSSRVLSKKESDRSFKLLMNFEKLENVQELIFKKQNTL